MKRVVFSLSLFFLLSTLSTAFRVTKLDLTHATKLSDHDDHIESTNVTEHSRSQETEIITKEYIDHLKQMNPVDEVGFGMVREGVDEVGFVTVEEDEGVKPKELVNEVEFKEYDEHAEDREKHILKKIGKFLGYF